MRETSARQPQEQDNVKRAAAWRDATGGTIEMDDYEWWVARDGAGIMAGRRPDLGMLMDVLEGS